VIKRSGSKMILYMTWAREHSPEHQKAIAEAYISIGKKLNALVVPAGTVWQAFRAKHDSPNLYASDGSHPSPAGSYLVACVFLATLFNTNPVGLEIPPGGMQQSHALMIQRYAAKHVGSARTNQQARVPRPPALLSPQADSRRARSAP
jgi:hypothetical protein